MPSADQATQIHAVILAHPDPDSFNVSVAEAYCDQVRACGHMPVLRDLYALHFDPVLRQDERPDRQPFDPSSDVRREWKAIEGAAAFVFIYPIWFGTPPAMLKGYVERVLGAGISAIDVQNRFWSPRLSGKRLLSFTSSALREAWLTEQGQAPALRAVFDEYLAHAFSMERPDHVHFGSISATTPSVLVDEHLAKVRDHARQLCRELDRQRPAQASV